jgi:hypothetical protein
MKTDRFSSKTESTPLWELPVAHLLLLTKPPLPASGGPAENLPKDALFVSTIGRYVAAVPATWSWKSVGQRHPDVGFSLEPASPDADPDPGVGLLVVGLKWPHFPDLIIQATGKNQKFSVSPY